MKIAVFLIARRIVELATNVTTPNNKLRVQVRMFVAKSSSALSKLMPLNNKQAFPVLFMSEGSYVPSGEERGETDVFAGYSFY